MSELRLQCFKCRHVWTHEPPLERRAECPRCHADAHVCLNCRFYDPGAHHECREEQAEWVKEKDRANFCSYFEAEQRDRSAEAAGQRAKLDGLFKGAQASDTPKPGASLADDLKKFMSGKNK